MVELWDAPLGAGDGKEGGKKPPDPLRCSAIFIFHYCVCVFVYAPANVKGIGDRGDGW